MWQAMQVAEQEILAELEVRAAAGGFGGRSAGFQVAGSGGSVAIRTISVYYFRYGRDGLLSLLFAARAARVTLV